MENGITYLGYGMLVIGIIVVFSIKRGAKVDAKRTKPSGGGETGDLRQWHNESDKAIHAYALGVQFQSSVPLFFLTIGAVLLLLKDLFF